MFSYTLYNAPSITRFCVSISPPDVQWPGQGQGLPNGDFQHIWSNGVDDNGLAHMSSELFSSSLMFLGQDLAHSATDMSQPAGEDVTVPPGREDLVYYLFGNNIVVNM